MQHTPITEDLVPQSLLALVRMANELSIEQWREHASCWSPVTKLIVVYARVRSEKERADRLWELGDHTVDNWLASITEPNPAGVIMMLWCLPTDTLDRLIEALGKEELLKLIEESDRDEYRHLMSVSH